MVSLPEQHEALRLAFSDIKKRVSSEGMQSLLSEVLISLPSPKLHLIGDPWVKQVIKSTVNTHTPLLQAVFHAKSLHRIYCIVEIS